MHIKIIQIWWQSLSCFSLNGVPGFIRISLLQLHWLDADVFCLQEVDPFYFPHLLKELAICGYDGMFQEHTSRSDGVAMFFKKDKFYLKNYEVFGFNEILGEVVELDKFKNRNAHNQRLAQYVLLQDVKSEKEVAIGMQSMFNCSIC